MSKKTLEACRQKVQEQLDQINRQIAQEKKELARVESRITALTRDQRKAA